MAKASQRLQARLEELRRQLAAGHFASGDRVITSIQLSNEAGVTVETARLQLAALAKEGILRSRRGNEGGFYATDNQVAYASTADHVPTPSSISEDVFPLQADERHRRDRTPIADHLKSVLLPYPPGSKLPTTKRLVALLGVRRQVLFEALMVLKTQGIIESRVGGKKGGIFTKYTGGAAIQRELTYSPWRKRVTAAQFVAHCIAKHCDMFSAGSGLTIANIAHSFHVGHNTADAARNALKDANLLEVRAMSAGTRIANNDARLADVLIDETTAEAWLSSVDTYPLPPSKSGIAEQVIFDVRRRLESGQISSGQPLPGRATLRAIYRIDDKVIEDLYLQLIQENLLQSKNGGYYAHSDVKCENLQGVSPLGKLIFRERESGVLKRGSLSIKALQQRYGAAQTKVDAAIRQLKHVGGWEYARPVQITQKTIAPPIAALGRSVKLR